jgi:hypothetical protein
MPFGRAVKLLDDVTGVQISEATGRRQTEAAGAVYESWQNEQADQLCGVKPNKSARSSSEPNKSKAQPAESKLLLRSDGATVALVAGEYAEIKTLVIGRVQPKEKPNKERADQQVETTDLTYFSRLTDSETFSKLATVETERRAVRLAKEVCAVQDGAEWIQGFVDMHRPNARRILDFAHAKGYLVDIATMVKAAGTTLPADWLELQCHELKHHGPSAVLKEVGRLLEKHPDVPDLETKVNYLRKREQQMQYPLYQQLGWPIGSGSVESANKCVVQARLKGAGMRWERSHVNPMLALRTEVCHDRWEEAWGLTCEHRSNQRMQQRISVHQLRRDQALHHLQLLILRIALLASPARLTPAPMPLSRSKAKQTPKELNTPAAKSVSDPSAPPVSHRPAPNHPWRRPLLAKK